MENTIVKKQGIFINLDVLLDTRLATIFLLDPELMKKSLSANYFTRKEDSFVGIDKEIFKEAYSKRDKNTLKNSTICKIVNMIREIVKITLRESLSSPLHTGPKIFLNTYPYVLEENEEKLLVRALIHITEKLADIQIVNINLEDLTPKFIKDNLAVLFMYEYGAWLDIQAENFKKTPCPEISLIVPELYFSKIPTKAELDQLLEEQMHPFRLIEKISSPLIGLKLYEIDLFCANIK